MDRAYTPGGGNNRKYKRIGLKIGGVVVILQMFSVLLVMLVCIFMYNSLITKMQKVRCTNGTNMLAYELGRVSADEDMNLLLDGLKSRMGCEFTIFEGDTRAYSTVVQDGQRVVGTRLSSDLNAIVLQQGRSYVGEASIQGEKFLCSYVPTKGEDGTVNGLIFAGISRTEARQEVAVVVVLAILATFATIVFGMVFLTAYLKKQISNPLGEITRVAGRLEKGDLGLANNEEIRVNVSSNDEIGMLGQMFEDTIRRLRSYIGEISSVLGSMAGGNMTQSASQDYLGDFQSIKKSLDSIQAALNSAMGQIASSADQVSSSAQALAQGATEQASSIEEVSATMMDISQNAKKTSAAAEEAGEYVNQAGSHLGVSIEFVKELNVAMENISGSSKKIGTIISTIEDIAFQINILALNAAVEAARAGSAGKGFAVVADEVSNLASKSDEAAKATKKLIESSIAAVTEGGQIVDKVTEALDQTSQSAGHVTSQMAIVVEAVEKQTAALSQVTDGIDQISSVVQTNSATSQECAAASEELSSQANLLKNLMRSFKLRDMR